jgi:hypothetical protein
MAPTSGALYQLQPRRFEKTQIEEEPSKKAKLSLCGMCPDGYAGKAEHVLSLEVMVQRP